jgi:glycosyltransferase involved in cell wall biosynthesis
MIHYRDDFSAGGSLRVGETLVRHFDPSEVEAHFIFAYGGPGPVAGQSPVKCHFIGSAGPRDLGGWCRFRSLLARERFDILHFQDSVVWMHAASLAMPPRRIAHVHGRAIRRYLKLRHLLMGRFLGRLHDGQICISEGALEAQRDLGLSGRARLFRTYNAVDIGRFSAVPEMAECRRRLQLPQGKLLLGMVCRLTWQKGCKDLLQLMTRLPARWEAVIAGEGPQRQELETLTRSMGLEGRVHFLGLRNDVLTVYGAIDAMAFLTRYEPFGLVIAEAMAARVPVFGLRGEGEYYEPQCPLVTADNAVFVDRENPHDYGVEEPAHVLDALAARIAEFGEDPGRYGPMREAAYEWVRRHFDGGRQAREVTAAYRAIVGGPRGGDE